MTDRPILFSGPMVRALLDGTKTQTRRVLRGVPDAPQPDCHPNHTPKHPKPYLDAYCSARKTATNPRGMSTDWCWWQVDDRPGQTFRIPYAPGDRLWVRETWSDDDAPPGEADYQATIATDANLYPDEIANIKWKPSIHMPRWASRLTLIVTDVRVQRLQEISEEDAIAEGIEEKEFFGCPCWKIYGDTDGTVAPDDPIASFASLWDHCHGPGAWDADPWVVATTFTVHRGNIDQMGARR